MFPRRVYGCTIYMNRGMCKCFHVINHTISWIHQPPTTIHRHQHTDQVVNIRATTRFAYISQRLEITQELHIRATTVVSNYNNKMKLQNDTKSYFPQFSSCLSIFSASYVIFTIAPCFLFLCCKKKSKTVKCQYQKVWDIALMMLAVILFKL